MESDLLSPFKKNNNNLKMDCRTTERNDMGRFCGTDLGKAFLDMSLQNRGEVTKISKWITSN
jgi:hypothetical protein